MYKLYKIPFISEQQEEFIHHCDIVYEKLKLQFGSDTTWNYGNYNIFVESATSTYFYELLQALKGCIRDYANDIGVPEDQRMWIQAWMNYHKSEDVLKWHGHDFDFHGYVSIDPKNTKTIFKNWEIENETGLLYIGPGGSEEYNHKVEVLKPYDGHRITIAFDVTMLSDESYNRKLMPL